MRDESADIEEGTAGAGSVEGEYGYCSGEKKYCDVCQAWFNGPVQFEDHRCGKKHREKEKRLRQSLGLACRDPDDPNLEVYSPRAFDRHRQLVLMNMRSSLDQQGSRR